MTLQYCILFFITKGLHTENASKVGNFPEELFSKKKGLSSYLDLKYSCGTLDVDIKTATTVVAENGKKDSAAELSKAVMLLMWQCQSVEHGNNVDFLW